MYKPSPAPSGRESASLGLLTVLRHLYGVIIADEKTQTSSVSFFKGEKKQVLLVKNSISFPFRDNNILETDCRF